MIVTLERSKSGGLMTRVDDMICFFDRKSKVFEENLDPGDEVNIMFTGSNRQGSVLFISPIKKNQKLLRHKGFQPMGKNWDIMAEATFPRGSLILQNNISIPIRDGRNIELSPGICWVERVNHKEARYKCVGVENPWNLNFHGGSFCINF